MCADKGPVHVYVETDKTVVKGCANGDKVNCSKGSTIGLAIKEVPVDVDPATEVAPEDTKAK